MVGYISEPEASWLDGLSMKVEMVRPASFWPMEENWLEWTGSGTSSGSPVSSSFKSDNSWINSCLNPVCSCASNSWTALANPALITLEPDLVVGPLRMMGTSVVGTATEALLELQFRCFYTILIMRGLV